MLNNILVPSTSPIRSMLTVPLEWVSVDMEYIRHENKFVPIEFAVFNIEKMEMLFESFIIPDFDFRVSKRLEQRGVSKNDILQKGKSIHEINSLLEDLLRNKVCVFWNSAFDLRQYPLLEKYAYDVRCCMKRHSERHGPYNLQFGDHNYCRLEEVASEIGFTPASGKNFHEAAVDAEATAFIWENLDKATIPGYLDLVQRNTVDDYIKGLYLEDKSETDKDVEGSPSPIPF